MTVPVSFGLLFEKIKMSAKRSPIWDFFQEIDDGRSGKCVECNSTLSRAGGGKKGTNTSMINHLKTHPKLFEMYKAKESEMKTAKLEKSSQQMTIVEAFSTKTKWDPNSGKAEQITKAVAEMIILDLEPLRVVEKSGFKRLLDTIEPRYQVTNKL